MLILSSLCACQLETSITPIAWSALDPSGVVEGTVGPQASTMPAIHPMKPGSAGPGMPGIHPLICDEDGNVIECCSGMAGNICIKNPWPGGFETIYGDRKRYVSTYYEKYCRNPESAD